jgi:hypothetical protein
LATIISQKVKIEGLGNPWQHICLNHLITAQEWTLTGFGYMSNSDHWGVTISTVGYDGNEITIDIPDMGVQTKLKRKLETGWAKTEKSEMAFPDSLRLFIAKVSQSELEAQTGWSGHGSPWELIRGDVLTRQTKSSP